MRLTARTTTRAMSFACGLVGIACAPPDPVQGVGSPVVSIVSPRPDQTELEIDEDGMLRFVLAVDVDGFEFLAPGEGTPGDVTQGHFHAYVNGSYEGAAEAQAMDIAVAAEPDQQIAVRAVLATDDHQEIFIDGAPVQDIVEFVAVAPVADGGAR